MASAVLTPESKLAVFRRATELLASSRSFDETMAHTIAAFLPVLGDFGFFDLDVGGHVQRTARAFEDPRVEGILRPTGWIRQERTDMNLCALSTGRPALHAVIDDAWYQAIAVNEGHLQVLRDLGFISMISVPMRYQGELLGALTLFFGTSRRHYDDDHLAFAVDLAALAAPVVANARLLEHQRKITEALRISEERLRIGMAAGNLGVWDWDVVGDRVSWSEGLYALFGTTREQFGGRLEDVVDFVHPDDREQLQRAIREALDGAPFESEHRVCLPDGSVRWLASTGEVHRDETGKPIRFIGALQDVTERRALLQAAEQANRAKDEFLAMLGHELRNPLAPIVSALQLMDVRDRVPFRRERDIIARQVEHLTRLVDDLLDVARITRGKIALARERLDLVELVERAAESHREVPIRVEAASRPLVVDGDPVRLAQVVGNLIANAAKFSPPGEPIAIRMTSTSDGIELVVEDRGAGIDPALLPRVFEMFVQGPQELARERGGLGLGLAIVAKLVELHGGTVTVTSEVGRGSQFRIVLPRASAPAPDAPRPANRALHASGVRVLVVDDNADAAETLGDLLRVQGHEVAVVATAEAALQAAGDFAPEVAVLDLGLPEMDGYELARALRGRSPSTRLIAVTGYGRATDRERTQEAGFDDHLVKPIQVTALLDRIAMLAR